MIFQTDKATAQADRPVETAPVKQPKDNTPRHSIISAELKIKGDLESSGDITIEGQVEGNIKCRTLTLGEAPIINSSVEADTVRICGVFTGTVRARKVILTRTAKVSGDIYHESIQVDEGATIEGRVGRLDAKAANSKAKVEALRPASGAS